MQESIKKENKAGLRPRFRIELEQEPEAVYHLIATGLKKDDCPVLGHAIPGYASMKLPAKDRQIWSPILTLTIEENESGGSLIRGMYSPAPGIWTLVMFLYVILGFSLFIILMWQFSNYSLGQEMSELWWGAVVLLAMAGLWIFARIGQQLSAHQMQIMQDVLDDSLNLSEGKQKE